MIMKITGLYGIFLMMLVRPTPFRFSQMDNPSLWLIVVVGVAIQLVLLFLTINSRLRETKPIIHRGVSAAVLAFLFAVLTGAFLASVLHVILVVDRVFFILVLSIPIMWIFLSILFFNLLKEEADISNLVAWLFKGSLIVFLISIPCDFLIRSKHPWSGILAGWGTFIGVAFIFMALGPMMLNNIEQRDGAAK